MAFQATPKGVKVEMVYDQNGTPVVNIFHCETADTVTATDLENATTAFEQWHQTYLRLGQHQSLVLQQIIATDISVENGQQFILADISNPAGNITSAAAGANVASVISWRTPYTGRSYRGRTYLGGIANADLVDAQHLSTGYVNGVAATAAELIDILNTFQLTLSVLSRFLDGALRVVGILTAITAIIVDNKVDSQRKRTAN